VEMMVGVAIGLFVVAAAVLVVATQLNENRRLLVETQVQQDLRATADIVTRELRRVGAWHQSGKGVWFRGTTGVTKNPFSIVVPDTAPASEVDYKYHRSAGSEGWFKFRLNGNVIQADLGGGGGFQDLTDARTLKVTAFTITPQTGPAAPARIPCPKLCADGTQDCWPTVVVREFVVDIAAEAANDPSVKRSLQSTVSVRNDWVRFNDAANPNRYCPL
jgi:type II secretory pathway component PulJ